MNTSSEARLDGLKVHEGLMKVATGTVAFDTPGNGHIECVTDQVGELLRASGLTCGVAVIFAPGATGAVTTLEFEPGVVHDLRALLDSIAPPDAHYAHNDNLGDGNGHSHVRAGLLGPSLTVPFADGLLTLGRWQEIVFCDFDARRRSRRIVVQLTGI